MNPEPRYKSETTNTAIKEEIQILLRRGAFEFINRKEIYTDATVIVGRFILAIKQQGTQDERDKV